MSVKTSDEPRVRRAAAVLTDQITKFKANFGAADRQDIYAILAFDAVFERLQLEEKGIRLTENVSENIDLLNQLIDS